MRAAGIPAVVDYTPMGKTCREPRGRPATVAGRGRQSMSIGVRQGRSTTFTITRGSVQPGQTLVIMSSLGSGASSVGTVIVQGPVAPCDLVDGPPLPARRSGDTGPGFSTGGAAGGSKGASPSTHTGP